jgi:hypothetical protein
MSETFQQCAWEQNSVLLDSNNGHFVPHPINFVASVAPDFGHTFQSISESIQGSSGAQFNARREVLDFNTST